MNGDRCGNGYRNIMIDFHIVFQWGFKRRAKTPLQTGSEKIRRGFAFVLEFEQGAGV